MWRPWGISLGSTGSGLSWLLWSLFLLLVAAQMGGEPRAAASKAEETKIRLVLQTGHRGGVHGAAFSPHVSWDRLGFPARSGQGEILASGGNDGNILLWDPSSGVQVRTLNLADGSSVGAVAFRDDGLQIAATGGTTKIWNVASGELLHSFENTPGHGRSIAFSRDGRYLAVGTDKEIIVWDTEAGKETRRFVMSYGLVAFGKGPFLAGAASMPLEPGKSVDLSVHYYGKVWNVETGTEVFSVRGDTYYVKAVTFGADNSLSIWGSGNCVGAGLCNSVHLWTLGDSASRVFQGPGTFFTAAGFCPDKNFLLGGTNDGKAVLWNVAEQKVVYESEPIAGAFSEGVDCSAGQTMLASSDMSGRVILRKPTSHQPDRILHGLTNEIDAAEFIGRSSELLQENRGMSYSKGYVESATIWETATDGTARFVAATLPVVTSPDGKWQLSGNENRTFILRGRSGTQLDTQVPSQGTIVAFSPSGRLVATAREQKVTIRTVNPWKEVSTLPEMHKFHVEHMAFNPQETMLAIADDDGTVSFWDAHSWQFVKRLGEETTPVHAVWTVAFSPDGTSVAWGGNDQRITITDVTNWRTLRELSGHQSAVHCVAFSPSGDWLASAGWDGTVRLWPLREGKEKVLYGHDWLVSTVAFNSKGNLLVSAGWDGSVRLWDTKGSELATLVTFQDRENWLVSTPEGLFDGSANSGRNIYWRTAVNNEVQPLESYYTDYFYPGLLAEVVSGARPQPAVNISAVVQIPGLRLALRQKRAHIEIKGDALVVCFDSIPGVAVGAIPGEPDIPAEANGFRVDPENRTCKYQKELPSGQKAPQQLKTELEKWASDHFASPWDGKASTTKQATLHVLTIGITKYADVRNYSELPYAETSAKALHDFFARRAAAHPGYASISVEDGLYGSAATGKRIVDKLSELSTNVRPEDVVLIYLSGHGAVTAGQEMFYFVPFDGQESRIQETGLDTAILAESMRKLPAKRLVLIIDACESGGALDALTKVGEVKARAAQRRLSGIGQQETDEKWGVGFHLIAAALPLSYAAVQTGSEQSSLAATLLAGFQREGGQGTIREVIEYVNRELPDVSEKRGFRQVPLTSSIGLDFPLVPPESRP